MSFDIRKIPVHPLAAKLPKQAPHERAILKRSMEERGFDVGLPVYVYHDDKHGPTILAGANRRDVAVELGLDRIPFVEFHGDLDAAARFVATEQLGRRSPDKSGRAFIMAVFRKELGLNLEEAAEVAGVSLSQMEKASSVAHKSKRYTAKGLSNEISVDRAAKRTRRAHVEVHDEDPWTEINRTRDKMLAGIDALKQWAEDYYDPLLDRRGAEMLKETLRPHGKIVRGQLLLGQTIIEQMIATIKRNLPNKKCPTCKGAAGGCEDCGHRMYITPHEEAAIRNGQS